MRKIYYIPGMLSLICLPILFITMLPDKKTETVLRFSLPSDRPSIPGALIYNTAHVLAQTKGKHVITIDLDSNAALNNRKLLFIEHESMRINYSYDTNTVIKVTLSDSATYGVFVQLLNMMTADVIKRYALIGNDFYIFGDLPSVKSDPTLSTSICFLCDDVLIVPKRYTIYEKLKMKMTTVAGIFKQNKLLCISFIFLILIPLTFSTYSKTRKV